jgi:GT2 family glycosyltransferase
MFDVNIVIVNYKMKDKIEVCLSSLFEQLRDSKLNIQVVVVDNNSEDGIESMLTEKFPQVAYIGQQTNPGFGSSQNLGFKYTQAKYYFALNPDTIFHTGEHTIDKLYRFMEDHPKIGMIGPKLLYPDGALQYSCWRFPPFLQPFYQRTKLGCTKKGLKRVAFHHMKDFDHNSTIPVDAIMGSAMFVRREAYEEVGGFDERFWMYYEDIDWSWRMWDAGWPVYYVHDIVLTHIHGRGSAKIPGVFKALVKNKLARVHVQSWLKFLWKWRGKHKYYASKF